MPHRKNELSMRHLRGQQRNTGKKCHNCQHRYLPKQVDLDKILKIIYRKVLKGTHIPITVKEIQSGYLDNPYFQDIYLYLTHKRLLSSKAAVGTNKTLAEIYSLLDSLLFRLNTSPEKETAISAIPKTV